jgi:hypothetical protein
MYAIGKSSQTRLRREGNFAVTEANHRASAGIRPPSANCKNIDVSRRALYDDDDGCRRNDDRYTSSAEIQLPPAYRRGKTRSGVPASIRASL